MDMLNDVFLRRLIDLCLDLLNPSFEDMTLTSRLFEIILESFHVSSAFREAVAKEDRMKLLLAKLLVEHTEDSMRLTAKQHILRHVASADPNRPTMLVFSGHVAHQPSSHGFALIQFLWPIMMQLLEENCTSGQKISALLGLAQHFFSLLLDSNSPVFDLGVVLRLCTAILLKHNSIEDASRPTIVDTVGNSLVTILLLGMRSAKCPPLTQLFENGIVRKLFNKQLFVGLNPKREGSILYSTHTRVALCEILSNIARSCPNHARDLISSLERLVPFIEDDEDDNYLYELPFNFEREKHMRAPCGYVGLKNLSNTCYFNSLLTQLFMNLKFRQFMFKVNITDPDNSQELLYQTQKLFGFLQDSYRRSYDPSDCVASIKTYEDTMIDIHNQMDVEEFYNLLFDRWEGQLKSPEEKKEFRSLYGGQLVQQVKSKECDHVSERLEPFSAVQCDIKGKSNLQESLQAYVDGEIMQGDNKYKCSTCDRHVDAVKRACFKEIPDNVIFHLKRFEFNLRAMTRNKINDHFSFPNKIDMKPFTIEHLEGHTDRPEADSEDVFELVGVLVHAGTAESGHYYSYIRPRPSTTTSWVEFNDDVVTEWDPQQMESLCFGGYEYRTNFESTPYDKSWNAYMLFYQRSSSLKRELGQLLNRRNPEPAKARMPGDLYECITDDNLRTIRRHCLYDSHHIPWVSQVLSQMRWQNNNRCSSEHATEDLAIQMALGHLDQVASRAKDTPDFIPLIVTIRQLCQTCLRCSLAALNYFHRCSLAFRNMVQRNPDTVVRSESGALLMLLVEQIKLKAPPLYYLPDSGPSDSEDTGRSVDIDQQPIIVIVMDIFRTLMMTFYQGTSLRAWPEMFGTMVDFARLGRAERAAMLECDYLYRVLCMVVVDPGHESIPGMYQRMYHIISRRMSTRPVSYDNVLILLDLLLTEIDLRLDTSPVVSNTEGRLRDALDKHEPLPLTRTEYETIMADWKGHHGNILVDKLGIVGQNCHQVVDPIITKLIKSGSEMERKVLVTLKANIQADSQARVCPYLRMAVQFCRLCRSEERIAKLILHISRQCARGIVSDEGYHYFSFHSQVFDSERKGAGQSRLEVLYQGYAHLHTWAPGLLTYHEHQTRRYVEEFLNEKIFQIPGFDLANTVEGEEEEKLRQAICQAARQLGLACLEHLRRNFIQRGTQLTREATNVIRKVLISCEPFYTMPYEQDIEALAKFNNLRPCEWFH